jgi:hypothetical protein
MNTTSRRILGQICAPPSPCAPAEPVLAPAARTLTLAHAVRPAGAGRTMTRAAVRTDTTRIVPPAAI